MGVRVPPSVQLKGDACIALFSFLVDELRQITALNEMNIEREETGNLTATLKMKIQPEDYLPGVEKALKEQRKNAVLPGFRPGQVPMTIIKKKVGKALLIGEVERLIDANLKGYLQEDSLRVLGQPLPKAENAVNNNWEEPGEFNFSYELGMAPSFEVNLDKLGVEYPAVVRSNKEGS